MNENEFIPYEQALELKELGFDEDCLKQYSLDYNPENKSLNVVLFDISYFIVTDNENYPIKAPLYQQAFRWFREKYKLISYIKEYREDGKFIVYEGIIEYPNGFYEFNNFKYEEVELACLKKLIEIAKNK